MKAHKKTKRKLNEPSEVLQLSGTPHRVKDGEPKEVS